jgi:hypothetical protein
MLHLDLFRALQEKAAAVQLRQALIYLRTATADVWKLLWLLL